jgi:prepilin-type N-terminal cleavage/methylation domain-containing protein
MISLKNKSKGFTIVELLIVIVVIGILATLVIVTFTGIQQKARNSQRQTDINALDSHLEAFYAENGYYPTYNDLTTASFVSDNLKGLDPQALIGPKGGTLESLAASTDNPTGDGYGYNVGGCTATDPSSTTNGCTSFTLKAALEGSSDVYSKSSNT